MDPIPNIILFGETGSGKSSIVNMISETETAVVSGGATGCTFRSQKHVVTIGEKTLNIYDTVGLDEGDAGTVPKEDAIVQLYTLVRSLKAGVNLLIFCMRGPRLKESAPRNWRLFHEIMCQKKVPIVIAITGLELEPGDMDNWWYRNKAAFQVYGMLPAGFACIVATRGRQTHSGVYTLEQEYEESKVKMWKLIMGTYLERPWKVESIAWYAQIIQRTHESDWCWRMKEKSEVVTIIGPGIRKLVALCELSEAEAKELGTKLESVGKSVPTREKQNP